MDAGVILAAGDSTRMGFPKQLAEIKDKPLLELVIEKVNSNFELSTVVLGYENELIQEKINFYNSNILINENWEEGIVSSIRTALFFYQEQKQIENLIFFLGDQPEVKDDVIFKLLNNESNNSKILIPQYRYKLGFPILIGTSRKRFINQISGLYDSNERIGGTLASILFLLSQGVQIFRVHNVREVKQGILVFEKILNSK